MQILLLVLKAWLIPSSTFKVTLCSFLLNMSNLKTRMHCVWEGTFNVSGQFKWDLELGYRIIEFSNFSWIQYMIVNIA
jgi:hypothetical protein